MKIPTPDDDVDIKDRKFSEKDNLNNNNDAAGNNGGDTDENSFPHYKRVSDYLLGTCIGEGSFAKVRVGFHCPTKEKVAVKIINKAKAKRDSYVFKNLHREGKLMQMLRHPNIVQVFDILETGNNYYLVTELCTGGELIDIVTDQGSLPEERVRKYMSQLVNAVVYLHERKIVHRDLKVENLLLDSDDNIKIIDFGLSNNLPQLCSDISSSLMTQCGSPAYAAPELLAKRAYGPKVDVWSIGVITFALLVGKLPFTVEPFHIPKLCKKMMRGEMNPMPSFVSSQCRYFIRKLLSPDHTHRPTINDVTRLKWISSYQSDVKKSPSKNLVSSLFIDHLTGDANFRQRHNHLTPMTSPPIDSSVVKEMGTAFGFGCSDVIQCVHKNRPGPALATYHLILRRRKSEKERKMDNSRFNRAIQAHVEVKLLQEQVIPKPTGVERIASQSTDDAKTDSGSAPLSEEDLTITPPLPKLRTPESDNDDASGNSEQSSSLGSEEQQLNSEKTSQRKVSSPTYDVMPSEAQKVEEDVRPLLIGKPTFDMSDPMTTLTDQIDMTNGIAKAAPRTDIPVVHVSPSIQQPVAQSSPARAAEDHSSNRTDVNELLASMRKAREVLQRRQQQVELRNRLNLAKRAGQTNPPHHTNIAMSRLQPSPEPKAPSKHATEITVSPLGSRKPQPLRRSSHSRVVPRSTSQQGTRTHDDQLLPPAPQSPYRRPASHNAVISKMPENIFAQRRYVYTPTSPSRPKYAPDWLRSDDPSEGITKSKDTTTPKGNHVPSTLPEIVPKPKPEKVVPRQPVPRLTNGVSRLVRRSLPAANDHYESTGNKRLSLNAEKKPDIANRDRRSLDNKASTTSKWQKSHDKETSKNVMVNKSKYGYYLSNRSENPPTTTQRPRKVISEPIAAAISYLTSTKNRAFRKEKTPFMTTR